MKDAMTAHFRSYLNIYCSDPFFLEIMPRGVDKAHALVKLLGSIGLSTEQMICCGDGYNDITMIETAGLGVAMANAQPPVLDSADYITKSNDENGGPACDQQIHEIGRYPVHQKKEFLKWNSFLSLCILRRLPLIFLMPQEEPFPEFFQGPSTTKLR